jgi:hypothetical protein
MQTDIVKIGPLEISRVVFDIFIPLISVVIGGLITYLTTRALESRKWKQEKKDKLQEKRREALALALEWLAPIEAAWIRASSVASAFIRGDISEEEFRKRWPDLLSELVKRDLPASLNVLLPPEAHKRGLLILRQLDDLRHASYSSGITNSKSFMEKFEGIFQHQENIRENMRLLEKELVEEYNKTFS